MAGAERLCVWLRPPARPYRADGDRSDFGVDIGGDYSAHVVGWVWVLGDVSLGEGEKWEVVVGEFRDLMGFLGGV